MTEARPRQPPSMARPLACEAPNAQVAPESALANLKYLAVGMFFGVLFIKGELVSWFRIQEMFRFASVHMYGVIGSAVVVGTLSVWLIRVLRVRTLAGEIVVIPERAYSHGQVVGGLMFGVGWALTGACPGPLFAQIGAGYGAVGVTLVSAIAGTWLYGYFRERLPH